MEMQEIRKLNIDELMKKLDDSRREHMDLRFKKASMQLSDSSQVKKNKEINLKIRNKTYRIKVY